jgi:hypothetical protein
MCFKSNGLPENFESPSKTSQQIAHGVRLSVFLRHHFEKQSQCNIPLIGYSVVSPLTSS